MLTPLVTPKAAAMASTLGTFGPIILAGVLGILLIALAVPIMLKERSDPLNKLKQAREGTARGEGPRLRHADRKDKLERFSHFLEPQDEEKYSAVRMALIRAGYRTKSAVRIFYFAQLTLALGALVVGLVYILFLAATSDEPIGTPQIMMAALPALIGYMAPKRWIASRAEKRQKQIIEGFPDSLDLMLVCVEAGQSFDQAVMRVAREMQTAYPALSEEYQLISYEIKAGKERASVLRDFAERVGVPDVSSFVTVLIQSQTFGTPISESIRVFSAEMRDKRLMRAEEAANKLPTKMTLMTMALTVPPLMVILVGPSVYDIYLTLNSGGVPVGR
ncbi:tight adherence protein C [Meinhardsimonia xiamenensis]|jgi:tight adherence protein C|uniref:Tight adherence protein C n=2 Tax=Meinhardsimonia xiamenensis TaxID=990712 RepID=A0A1G9CMP7_9RHOB|nr:type II secretion system F family protein [Meinhardsimonia xiamenensis]PRX38311.1 tight adherence protein C [Meinhardsimonia xiamenensis]SDK52754.1 tight adherence protein C [Meinhardsimonia xiamenensis]